MPDCSAYRTKICRNSVDEQRGSRPLQIPEEYKNLGFATEYLVTSSVREQVFVSSSLPMSLVSKDASGGMMKQSPKTDATIKPRADHFLHRNDSLSPAKTSNYGNLLEVPTSYRDGLSSHSTSVSTDEGIVMDDAAHHVPLDCFHTVQHTRIMEGPDSCWFPDLFCARCYNPLSRDYNRAEVPMTHLYNHPTRNLVRMNSEEVPRTRPPSGRCTGYHQIDPEPTRNYQRIRFEQRGHSISDAQVPYHPNSTEFMEVKPYRRCRKLPPIPQRGSLHFSQQNVSTKSVSQEKMFEEPIRLKSPIRNPKPRLQRQNRQYRDPFEEKELSPVHIRSPCATARNSLAELSDYDNNDATEHLHNSKEKTSKKSSENVPHVRAKSIDYTRKETPRRYIPVHSKTFDKKDTLMGNTTKERSISNTSVSPRRNERLSCGTSAEKNDDTPGDIPNDSKSPIPQKSLAEQLMSIAPTDQRRVQGIVQDVLFEMGEERMVQYRNAFSKYDKDKSGIISSKQLRRLLRTLGHNPGDDELRELVNQVDMDENGKIDFNEFIILVGHFDKANNTSEDLSHIFRVYDEAHGGNIDVEELRSICSDYLVGTVALENINEMIEFIDLDGDGEINRDELCRVWSTRW